MTTVWKTKPLGELLVFLTSGSRGWAEHYRETGDLFLRIQNVGRNKMLLDDVAYVAAPMSAEARRTLVEPGDVLLSMTADLGRTGVVPEGIGRAYINQHLAILRARNIHPPFLSAFLASPDGQKQIFARNRQGVKAGLNFDDIRSFEIPLPPLAEQRRIAAVLDAAEALRAKRRAARAQLDQLTQSIFLDMFGDLVANTKSWPLADCSSICERITVGIVVKPASYYVPTGVPALRSLNVKAGYIALNDLVYFSSTDNETKLAKTKLKADDVVLVRSGQPGTAAVVPATLSGVNAIDLLIVTPKQEIVSSTFLCNLFNSSAGRRLVLSEQRGQIQKHLNVGSLNACPIPVPPREFQTEYARRITAVERLTKTHNVASQKVDALFESLQYRAFRGEL